MEYRFTRMLSAIAQAATTRVQAERPGILFDETLQ
jgi:hypothetical protein